MASEQALDWGGIGWRLGATLLLVFLNGFFVAAEFALVKVRRVRVDLLSDRGQLGARVTRGILDHLDSYLSACQLGITLASLALGALGEPAVAYLVVTLAGVLGVDLQPDSPLMRAVALVVAFSVITVLHMTLGEQAPKMWALRRSESAALLAALPLRAFTAVFWPFIWLINALSNGILRCLGLDADGAHDPIPTSTEIRTALSLSARAGNISERAREIADNVFRVAEMEVRHILVPRVDVTFLSLADAADENLKKVRTTGHTRFPLCERDLDTVVGMVHSKDVLGVLLDDGELDLRALCRPPAYVPETQKLSLATSKLQRSGNHAALVVDEHGTVTGMLFLEDAIEEVVGPIIDEFDEPVKDVVQIAPGVFETHGGLALPEAAELFDLDLDGALENTLGGYLMTRLGRLPRAGDRVDLGAFRATVVDLTRRRVIGKLRLESQESLADARPPAPPAD